jgi:hypothetical protein
MVVDRIGRSFRYLLRPNQRLQPTPLSRRLTGGAPRKLLAEFSRGSEPSRGAADYACPLGRLLLVFSMLTHKVVSHIIPIRTDVMSRR